VDVFSNKVKVVEAAAKKREMQIVKKKIAKDTTSN